MLNNRIVILLFVLPFFYFAKYKVKNNTPKTVSCYYDNTCNESLVIFDHYKGVVIDTLPKLDSKYLWYNLTISDSKNGWFKLDTIFVAPGITNTNIEVLKLYSGMWVKTKHLQIHLWEGGGLNSKYLVYQKPILNSNIQSIHIVNHKGNILKIRGNWAKVKIDIKTNDKDVIGWIPRSNQCERPWTACCNDF